MNEIIKNDYTEIQKYFDDYYKEQLEKYESLKDYDNYLFTEVKYEPHCWVLGLAFLGLANLLADITHKELWDYGFERSKKTFFKHTYKSKNIRTVTRYLGVNKSDLLFNEDYIIIGLNIKDEKQLNKIEREIKNGKQLSRTQV